MNKLKPCPFCGGEVRLATNLYFDTWYYIIECNKCKCQTHFTEWDETGEVLLKSRETTIQEWNRRA